MKLKKISPDRQSKPAPMMSINKVGRFLFNITAIKEILKKDSMADLYQDQEDPTSWYLRFNEKGDIKIHVHKYTGASFSSASLAKRIKESTNNDIEELIHVKFSKPITDNGGEYIPLLIKQGSKTY